MSSVLKNLESIARRALPSHSFLRPGVYTCGARVPLHSALLNTTCTRHETLKISTEVFVRIVNGIKAVYEAVQVQATYSESYINDL
jgi:hypothetical protein